MSLQPVIQWAFSPDADVVAYRIYWRQAGQSYDPARRVQIAYPGPNWYRMTQLTWWVTSFVVMTAVDAIGQESGFSNELSVFVSGGLILK